ncbi:MAG: hypothetical protein U0822_04480 [Anaerolineae bacterium]
MSTTRHRCALFPYVADYLSAKTPQNGATGVTLTVSRLVYHRVLLFRVKKSPRNLAKSLRAQMIESALLVTAASAAVLASLSNNRAVTA